MSAPCRVAVQMDHPSTLKPAGDSTIALLREASRRDMEIFYYDPASLSLHDGVITAKAHTLDVLESGEPGKWFRLHDAEALVLNDVDVVLVRQDPPFDMHYITATYFLDMLGDHVQVINHPTAIRSYTEKLLPHHFAASASPATLITSNHDAIITFLDDHRDIIIKPLYGWGGHAVLRLKKDGDNMEALLEMIQLRDRQPIIAQPFLPEVDSQDVRVITINGNVCGAFARKPASGEIRANMRVGGNAVEYQLSETQRNLCESLAVQLNDAGLYLAGIDLIGEHLTEINVTSPTGVKTLELLYDASPASTFWDGLSQIAEPQAEPIKKKRRWWQRG